MSGYLINDGDGHVEYVDEGGDDSDDTTNPMDQLGISWNEARRRANPTERPEERDSLALIEARVAGAWTTPGLDYAWSEALADIRTLINEVKELREERAETKANLDEATARMLAQAERMDEMAAQILELSAITQRAEQMEEALRGLQWSASDYRAMDPQHRPSADAIITSIETVTGKALG